MFSHPYQIIKQRILDQVPAIQQVDYDLGHGYSSEKLLYQCPAVLIKFDNISTDSKSQNVQTATTNIRIRLITEAPFHDDRRIHNIDPDQHMTIMDELFACLQGYSATLSVLDQYSHLSGNKNDHRVFNGLQRAQIDPSHAPEGVMMTVQHFRALVWDTTMIRPKVAITQDLIVTKEILI